MAPVLLVRKSQCYKLPGFSDVDSLGITINILMHKGIKSFVGTPIVPTANNHGSLPPTTRLPMPTTRSNVSEKEGNDEQDSGGQNKPTTQNNEATTTPKQPISRVYITFKA
jgi:hypothetical protein